MIEIFPFNPKQFRVALKIYSEGNYKTVIKRMRGGPVKRALVRLINAGK